MAGVLAGGLPRLEVPWFWNGSAYLNDTTNKDAHVALKKVTRSRTADEQIEPNAGRRGSYALPTSIKTSVWTVEGIVRARTLEHLRNLEIGLDSAFRDRQNVGVMVLLGDPAWFFQARVMALDIPDEQVTGNNAVWRFRRDFALQLTLLDPRAYLLIPATSGPHAKGATATLVNEGGIDTDPTFTFPGFAGGDLIGTNSTLGVTLKFRDLPPGDVEVRFADRSCKVGTTRRTGRLDPESTWWNENEQGLIAGAQSVTWNAAWSAVWFAGVDA